MSHCVLKYRGNYYNVPEERLLDAVAIAQGLARQDVDTWSGRSMLIPLLNQWSEFASEHGGMGILNPPFDVWFFDDAVGEAFVAFLEMSVARLRSFGKHLPMDIVLAAVVEPNRYRGVPQVWPYVRALGQLRALISQGLEHGSLPSDHFFLPYRGNYRTFPDMLFLNTMMMACEVLETTTNPEPSETSRLSAHVKLWTRFCDATLADMRPDISVRINDPPLDEWLEEDSVARQFVNYLSAAIEHFSEFGSHFPKSLAQSRLRNAKELENALPVAPSIEVLQRLSDLIMSQVK